VQLPIHTLHLFVTCQHLRIKLFHLFFARADGRSLEIGGCLVDLRDEISNLDIPLAHLIKSLALARVFAVELLHFVTHLDVEETAIELARVLSDHFNEHGVDAPQNVPDIVLPVLDEVLHVRVLQQGPHRVALDVSELFQRPFVALVDIVDVILIH